MMWFRVRRSRRVRRCEGCRGMIEEGDRYLVHVASPGDNELGNTGWDRCFECSVCATIHGRLTVEEGQNER